MLLHTECAAYIAYLINAIRDAHEYANAMNQMSLKFYSCGKKTDV